MQAWDRRGPWAGVPAGGGDGGGGRAAGGGGIGRGPEGPRGREGRPPGRVPAAGRRQRVEGGERKHLRAVRHLLRGEACGGGRRPAWPPGPRLPPHLVTRPATPRPRHTSTPRRTPRRRERAPQGEGRAEAREGGGAGRGGEGPRAGASWLEERRWFDERLWLGKDRVRGLCVFFLGGEGRRGRVRSGLAETGERVPVQEGLRLGTGERDRPQRGSCGGEVG